jgi:hypothetical protein
MGNVENHVWTSNDLRVKYKGAMISNYPSFFGVTHLQLTHLSIGKTPRQPDKNAQITYWASPFKTNCCTHVMLSNILHQTYTKSHKLLRPIHNPKLQLWWSDLQLDSSIHYCVCPQHFFIPYGILLSHICHHLLCRVPNHIHPAHYY